jgi:hypothetical protein
MHKVSVRKLVCGILGQTCTSACRYESVSRRARGGTRSLLSSHRRGWSVLSKASHDVVDCGCVGARVFWRCVARKTRVGHRLLARGTNAGEVTTQDQLCALDPRDWPDFLLPSHPRLDSDRKVISRHASRARRLAHPSALRARWHMSISISKVVSFICLVLEMMLLGRTESFIRGVLYLALKGRCHQYIPQRRL